MWVGESFIYTFRRIVERKRRYKSEHRIYQIMRFDVNGSHHQKQIDRKHYPEVLPNILPRRDHHHSGHSYV